jgi:pantoate--beta-alanine ligase
MIIYKTIEGLQQWMSKQKKADRSIGFVPTMGALHQGHLSLIALSLQQNNVTICSIFVNPTQFNDPKDFEKYPITIEQDILLLEQAGCTVLFLPSVKEMYPNGTKPTQHYHLGFLETVLEGSFRVIFKGCAKW